MLMLSMKPMMARTLPGPTLLTWGPASCGWPAHSVEIELNDMGRCQRFRCANLALLLDHVKFSYGGLSRVLDLRKP